MNTILDISPQHNNKIGHITAQEIARQPETWVKTWNKICDEKKGITNFLEPILALDDINIILTGAGTSSFIGDTAAMSWQKTLSTSVRSIPTTDLVTHFQDETFSEKPLLLVSFSRSGNSPESTATVERANQCCSHVFHLIITCNPEGNLASVNAENAYVFIFPPKTEDQGLAMTNSFTSMLLAAIAIPNVLLNNEKQLNVIVEQLHSYGQKILTEVTPVLYKIAQNEFNRIVFLGSGPLNGIAKEGHLKVQELTNGDVVGKYDTFLGFRHGPKAVLNEKTLLVYLLSNDKEVKPYEHDLINQVNSHNIGLKTLALSESPRRQLKTDYSIAPGKNTKLNDIWWTIACALPAQIIGFYKSLLLNCNPDTPSPTGTIARVVEGVTIYPPSSQVSG